MSHTASPPHAAPIAGSYGWNALVPLTCDYLAPRVMALLLGLGAKRVLDLGSGNGSLCGALRAAGYETVGVEPDAGGLEIARTTHTAVPFYAFGVDSNPAALLAHESPFDAVVSTEVVEHLFAPHLLPRYAAGVLRHGGHLIVSTPYHGYLKNLALSVADKWDHHHTALWHGGHIKFFSRTTLSKLLHENGFDVVDFHGVGRLRWLWKSMVMVGRLR